MITIKYNQNILHIIDEDLNDITSCSLYDIVTITYLGPSKIIFPSPCIDLNNPNKDLTYPVTTASKVIIKLINKDEIILDSGIFDRTKKDIWDKELRYAYNEIMKIWMKAKKGQDNGKLRVQSI